MKYQENIIWEWKKAFQEKRKIWEWKKDFQKKNLFENEKRLFKKKGLSENEKGFTRKKADLRMKKSFQENMPSRKNRQWSDDELSRNKKGFSRKKADLRMKKGFSRKQAFQEKNIWGWIIKQLNLQKTSSSHFANYGVILDNIQRLFIIIFIVFTKGLLQSISRNFWHLYSSFSKAPLFLAFFLTDHIHLGDQLDDHDDVDVDVVDDDDDVDDDDVLANLLESREPSTIRLSSAWPT